MKRKQLWFVIPALMLCINGHLLGYSDGEGSDWFPYQISSIGDWQELMATPDDWGSSFSLTEDINLAGVAVTPVGNFFFPFYGVLDGGSNKIINAVIDQSGLSYVGLFGELYSGGHIRNLGVENVTGTGGNHVGGLVVLNYGTLTNCYVTGSVTGEDLYVGGLVGFNGDYSTLTACYAAGSVSGTHYVGGLVGWNYGPFISCYSTGSVSGLSYVGGLVGENAGGTLTECYAAGWVSGTGDPVSGLVAANDGGTVTDCFWDTETSGQENSEGGTGKTTEEMMTQSTFTDAEWDFFNVWFMPSHSYPRLAWEPRYSGGDGSAADPYQIANKANLLAMAGDFDHYDKCFILTADIDLAGEIFTRAVIAPDTENTEWDGFQGTVFTGVFDGNGKKIIHLTITGFDEDFVGLFGDVDPIGQIMDLGIVDANIQGRNWVGGLAGENDGTITSCYVTGAVSGSDHAGGLVGENLNGTIISCYATNSVNGTINYIGGLIGINWGSLTYCYSTGAVSGTGDDIGGLVGWNNGAVTDCFWDIQTSGKETNGGGSGGGEGKTTVEMKTLSTFTDAGWDFTDTWFMSYHDYPQLIWGKYSGGSGTAADPFRIANKAELLAMAADTGNYDKCFILTANIDLTGENFVQAVIAQDTDNTEWNDFQGAMFTGVFDGNGKTISHLTITNTDQDYAGLFGYVDSTGQIKNLGLVNVDIQGREYVGGLAGYSGGTLTSCYATGAASGSDDVGGLVGYSGGTLTSCYAGVTVTGTGTNSIGGLTGQNYYGSTMTACYATGSVDGIGTYIGGLTGLNYGSMTSCYATGDVSGTDYVGGLAGWNDSESLIFCHATGSVTAYSYAGGLLGWNFGSLTSCFATGAVSGTGGLYGGLVGVQWAGSIHSCYATGNVSGTDNYIGGLIGENHQGQIQRCYSIGKPTGNTFVGGFCGGVEIGGDYEDTGNFWDTQTSGTTASAMGTGKTTMQMKTLTTFTWVPASWDFINETMNGINDFWMMPRPGEDYPRLAWQSAIPGDIAGSYGVNYVDFAEIAAHWEQTGCPTGCGNADINSNGTVDITDLMLFADNWLKGI